MNHPLSALAFVAGVALAPSAYALTGDVTPDVIFGSGNANGSFTIETVGDLEIGLRAKQRFPAANIFNWDGNKTYTFDIGLGANAPNRSMWNFEWSINTDTDDGSDSLSTYDFLLSISGPGITGTISYDPLSAISTGYYLGTNSNMNGGAPFTQANLHDETALGKFNVAQNSVNVGFLAPVTNASSVGLFTVMLGAYDKSTGDEVALSTIHVNVVPGPAALPLLASGMVAFAWFRRRQRSAATAA
jgi:hypothetical protein